MPYARKYSRSRASSAKSIRRRRPTASNQKSQILSLSKKVAKVQRLTRQTIERQQFSQAYVKNLASNYTVQTITPTASWGAVFGANQNLYDSQNLVVDSLHMEYKIEPNTENDKCDITMVVLSAKSKKVLEETSNLTSFTINTDYVMYDGLCLVNLKRFKVHHYKRTQTITQQNVSTDEATGSYTTLIQRNNIGRFKHKINHKIKNTLGSWDDVETSDFPYYMHTVIVWFNNNSSIDLAYPSCTGQILWKTHALR